MFGAQPIISDTADSTSSLVSDFIELSISLRKCKGAYTSQPMSNLVTYNRVCPSFCAFLSSLYEVLIPINVTEALSDPRW